MITEEKMFLFALGSMYLASLSVAAGLYLAGASPLNVVIGGTVTGVIIYTTIWMFSAPYIQRPFEVEEDSDNG